MAASALHSKSDNIEVKINDKPVGVLEELFQLILSRYLIGLEWKHL